MASLNSCVDLWRFPLLQVGILYFQPSVFRCVLLRWVRLLGFATVYGTLTLKLYRCHTHPDMREGVVGKVGSTLPTWGRGPDTRRRRLKKRFVVKMA